MTEPAAFECVRIAQREAKPRSRGINYVREPGLDAGTLGHHLAGSAEHVDILKFRGFIPRLQPRSVVAANIEAAHAAGIEVALGGALIEAGLIQGRAVVEAVLDEAVALGIDHIEVGHQIVRTPTRHVAAVIAAATERGLSVFAEAGAAYGTRPGEDVEHISVSRIIEELTEYLEAGATRVILESEGLTENVAPAKFRWDVIDQVVSGIGLERLILEADDALVWTRLLSVYGFEVNLFVDISRVLRLEGARRGLWTQPADLTWRVGSFAPDAADA
jgi:phosphosulfolactate synthase (CoM biosynthesis protein A)